MEDIRISNKMSVPLKFEQNILETRFQSPIIVSLFLFSFVSFSFSMEKSIHPVPRKMATVGEKTDALYC